jgi:hypothetical protein
MPSVSEKQRGKMAILYRQGKITRVQWEHFKKIRKKRKKR